MRKLIVVPALVLGLALGACGEDDGAEDAENAGGSELTAAPEVTGSIEEQMQALNEAVAADDCEAFVSLTHTFLRARDEDGQPPEPGAAGTEEECKNTEQARATLDGVEFTESAEYGTVALTEGEMPKPVGGYDTMTGNWLLDSDGVYRHTFMGPADPAIGTEPAEGTDFDAVMDGMVEAVRSGDCSGADDVFHEAGVFAEPGSTPEEQCKGLAGGQIFAPAVKATDEPGVEQLGATLDLVWYGIATEDAYFTVTLSTPIAEQQGSLTAEEQGTFRVIDVLPNTEIEVPAPKEQAEEAQPG